MVLLCQGSRLPPGGFRVGILQWYVYRKKGRKDWLVSQLLFLCLSLLID